MYQLHELEYHEEFQFIVYTLLRLGGMWLKRTMVKASYIPPGSGEWQPAVYRNYIASSDGSTQDYEPAEKLYRLELAEWESKRPDKRRLSVLRPKLVIGSRRRKKRAAFAELSSFELKDIQEAGLVLPYMIITFTVMSLMAACSLSPFECA